MIRIGATHSIRIKSPFLPHYLMFDDVIHPSHLLNSPKRVRWIGKIQTLRLVPDHDCAVEEDDAI